MPYVTQMYVTGISTQPCGQKYYTQVKNYPTPLPVPKGGIFGSTNNLRKRYQDFLDLATSFITKIIVSPPGFFIFLQGGTQC